MAEDKEDKIWAEIKRRAKEHIKYGVMPIEFKVQDGKIVLADALPFQERIKIG